MDGEFHGFRSPYSLIDISLVFMFVLVFVCLFVFSCLGFVVFCICVKFAFFETLTPRDPVTMLQFILFYF